MAFFFKKDSYWSIGQLVVMVIGQLIILLVAFQIIFPAYATKQWASGFWPLLIAFIGLNAIGAFLEWAVHRYTLHLVVVPLAAAAAVSHRRHHGLTPVRLIGGFLKSDYPISRHEQLRSARFPPTVFWVWFIVFTPLVYGPLQLLIPNWPILLAGWCSMTWMHILYEVWHGLEHASYDRYWSRWIQLPHVGPWVARVYSFHLIHHWNPNCNLAIGGCFGLPIADWIFGTYLPAVVLPGEAIDRRQLVVPTPRFKWIQVLDAWALRVDRHYSLAGMRGNQ
jgi:hemolysin III